MLQVRRSARRRVLNHAAFLISRLYLQDAILLSPSMNLDWFTQPRRNVAFPLWLRNEVHNQLGNGVARDSPPLQEARIERLVAKPSGPSKIAIAYSGNAAAEEPKPGMFIWGTAFGEQSGYFEVEIVHAAGDSCSLCLGVVSYKQDLDRPPGTACPSAGLHCDSGRVVKNGDVEQQLPFRPAAGDRVGCGIRQALVGAPDEANVCDVYFTHNGAEVATLRLVAMADRLHPAVSLSTPKELVRLRFVGEHWTAASHKDEVTPMAIDSHDDDWLRLHQVKQTGQLLEYAGRGRSIDEVGLAQAKYPLSPANHYFELEIVDPGDSCYIAIGLARKDYPLNRHPGWNLGSIAYHADDGKIFVGSGTGDPFGPRCHKGDVMGCGIIFPPEGSASRLSDGCSTDDSDTDADVSRASQDPASMGHGSANGSGCADKDSLSASSDGDDDPDLNVEDLDAIFPGGFNAHAVIAHLQRRRRPARPVAKLRQIVKALGQTTEVQVYFTRNRKLIGKRQVCLPTGEYYPTIGMLSRGEKVHADLRPLTG